MSNYTVVKSKKEKVAVRKSKKGNESEDSDDYEAALAVIDESNVQTFERIQDIASQLSDKTYAGILKKDGLQSPEIPKKLTWTFPPGRKVALAKAAALKLGSVNEVKPAVSGKLEMVEKERSTKQFAVSTVQQPKRERKPSARARYCPIDKFGSYTSGTKKFASSALEPLQDDRQEGISSVDSSEVSSDIETADDLNNESDRKPKKARIEMEPDDALSLTGFPLLPDFEEESVKHAASGDIVEETKVSVNTDIDDVKLHEFSGDELGQLVYGHNSQLFYDCVEALPEGEYVDILPTWPGSSAFQNTFSCPKDCLLPTLQDADSVMNKQQRRSCEDAPTRCKYHYLCQKAFWGATSIDELQTGFTAVTKDYHMDVVMIGEGFTNSVWDHTNTLQFDVQKLWFYLKTYGRVQYDTVVPYFGEIPLAAVTLDFFMMLPIKAVFGYLTYHGVDVLRTPWQITSTIEQIQSLPVSTQVPYSAWKNYLIILLDYLHGIMRDEEDAFALMHVQYMVLQSPTLTKQDATAFIQAQFPSEGQLLQMPVANNRSSDHLALLSRAIVFAKSRKYKGEVYDKCSVKWVVFLYYILHKSYPPQFENGLDRTTICVDALTKAVKNRDRMALDLGRLLQGHHTLVSAMLQDHSLAFRLYGTAGKKASIGVQKLMAAGVAYMYFWLLYNSSATSRQANIDAVLPRGLLAYILSSRGILAPISEGQPQFESDCIPVHRAETVHESAATLIRTMEPCVLSLPPVKIRVGMTDADYCSHYENPLKMDKDAGARIMRRELEDFQASSNVRRECVTSPCLFPQDRQVMVDDTTVGSASGYLVDAGRRLVKTLMAIGPAQRINSLIQSPPPLASSHSSSSASSATKGGTGLKQAFLVRKNGTVQFSRTLPTVEVLNLTELKRRQAKKIASDERKKSSQLGQPPVITPRYKPNTHIIDMYEAYKDAGTMYTTDWTTITGGFDGNAQYLDELRFFEQDNRPVQRGDKLIMLYDVNRVMSSLFNCSHLLYTVSMIVGNKTYATFTESMWAVGKEQLEGFFPEKIMMRIPRAYILFEEAQTGGTPRTSTSEHPSLRGISGASGMDTRTIDDDTSSAEDEHDKCDVVDEAASDDTDARKIAKTSSIKMGRLTFKVVGKTAIRDDLQNAIAVCTIMEMGQLELLLSHVGVYGHTITAANIIAGIFRHGMEDSDFRVENLNVPLKHNKSLVQSQAWTPHKALYSNMAYQKYQLVANMTDESIRCVHFLQHKLALERNYTLHSWHDWLLHLEGYKQFVHELYGHKYSTFWQNVILEVQSSHIGERNSVPYLDALSNAMRTQLYHFASRDTPFTAPGESVVRHPHMMVVDDWIEVMGKQFVDFKSNLCVQKEMEFNYAQTQYKVVEPKAMGHKSKPGQHDIQPKLVGGKQPKVADLPVGKQRQLKKDAQKRPDVKKKPGGQVDDNVNVCVADLLNHYGASEQAVCSKQPCKYVHYDALPSKTSKEGVLKTCQYVASAMKLSEATKTWLANQVTKDKKFQ